jgi:hypothetical protein
VVARIEPDVLGFPRRRPADFELQRSGTVLGHRVERPGNLSGNPGPHQDVVDPGQHRPVERLEVGHLDLGQEVDAHRAVVPFLGQVNLDEAGEHGDAAAQGIGGLTVHRQELVRLPLGTSLGAEVSAQDIGADVRHREPFDRPAHVAADVAVLEAPDHDRVDHRAGDDPELSLQRDGSGEDPVRNPGPHATLDNDRAHGRGLAVDGILHRCSLQEIESVR